MFQRLPRNRWITPTDGLDASASEAFPVLTAMWKARTSPPGARLNPSLRHSVDNCQRIFPRRIGLRPHPDLPNSRYYPGLYKSAVFSMDSMYFLKNLRPSSRSGVQSTLPLSVMRINQEKE
jgi:hypothetical protein